MPIYDYRCLSCGYETEIQQRITEPALTVCPNCGQETFQRVISAAGGFVLKGTGFYNTDYKNNGSAKSAANGKSQSSEKSGAEKSSVPASTAT
ncbi:MAG: FmdB family transcriptional regulator [[Chlorobium] sp. 445]|nr:MAG: FmdB family transcriptional regulator [[Chlorobium] sp. 445]